MDEKSDRGLSNDADESQNPAEGQGKNEDDFAKLLEESEEVPEEGQILHGVVIKILKEYVAVDINRKSEGMLPLEDLTEEERAALKSGGPIDVMVERYDSTQGFVLLSRTKVLKVRVWDDLQKAFDEGTAVPGTIVAKVKGGFTVDIGVRAFLPGSQVDIRPVRDNDSVLGLQGKFKILKFSRKKANVVVSRRSYLEEERNSMREDILERVKEGDIVEARVKNITDYGVFMDLGGLDGLMHITDMSYGKVGHPSDLVKVGETLKVKVIRFDKEKGRISLGLKQTMSDPWLDIEKRYVSEQRAAGKVTNVAKYGAFIELEPGVEGLLHVSEMSWSKRMREPSDVLKAGDRTEVVILKVDKEHKKISLGLRQLLPNPWDELRALHPEGSVVDGTVKNVTDFGVFVDIGGEIDGLIHVSDISWSQRVKHPSELFKKGDKVTAKVIRIDPEAQKFSLSLKHLQDDPWANAEARFRKGMSIVGKVTRVTDFGIFVDLGDGIEGLAHVSELSREKIDTPHSLYKAGDEVGTTVLGVDAANKKISLSVRAYLEESERRNMESYMTKPSEGSENITALGEALRAKLKLNGE